MRCSGAVLIVLPAAMLAFAAPTAAQGESTGFHLLGPAGSGGPLGANTVCPNEPPPFLHWDLRQFPSCAIPYEVNGNIPAPNNPTAAQAVAAVGLAANTWNQVAPTPVSLFDNGAANPSPCSQAPAPDGHNCIAWDPNFGFDPLYGVTLIWRDPNNSGVILESDITLNPLPDGGSNTWQASPPDCADSAIGIQAVVLHELGHFLGLGHPDFLNLPNCTDDDPSHATVMYSSYSNACKTTLLQPDKDGVNYLYTPDLGDLPDLPYPTKVHGGPSGVELSGLPLLEPGLGPEHLFGFFRDPAVGNFPRYQYEWLAFKNGAIDDHAEECVPRFADNFDDGVSAFCECEDGEIDGPIWLTMHVKTAADVRGRSHPYGAGNAMYLNGWFDWNGDGDFQDANEHPIGASPGAAVYKAAPYIFRVTAPPGSSCMVRSRFRLDWREDTGQLSRIDSTLLLEKGAAQHGEVEDYVGICGVNVGGGYSGNRGGEGIPPRHPPNVYCHPMGAMPIVFPGAGTVDATELCHPPEPFETGASTATTFPAAGQDCMNTSLCFKLDINRDGIEEEQLCLNGPVCVNRGAPYVDDEDGLRTIDTEMVSLDMTGYSHFGGQIRIRLAPETHSLGKIKQTAAAADVGVDVSLETPAASFFDVFWQMESSLVGTSSVVGPTRVEANISAVPPGVTIPVDETPAPIEPVTPP